MIQRFVWHIHAFQEQSGGLPAQATLMGGGSESRGHPCSGFLITRESYYLGIYISIVVNPPYGVFSENPGVHFLRGPVIRIVVFWVIFGDLRGPYFGKCPYEPYRKLDKLCIISTGSTSILTPKMLSCPLTQCPAYSCRRNECSESHTCRPLSPRRPCRPLSPRRPCRP